MWMISVCMSVIVVFHLVSCGEKKIPLRVHTAYVVKKVQAPPQIDGVLEDGCWKDVPAMDFVLVEKGGKPLNPTSLRMIHDSVALYLAFECQDPDAASETSEFDGPVEDGDFVAVLIDAGSDTTGYFLVETAPTGAIRDAYVLNGGNGASVRQLSCWNCGKLKASVAVYGGGAKPGTEDRFWTIEMAIPFAEIVTAPNIPPRPGDVWRMNFCRTERTGGMELSAAFPAGSVNFHSPYAFSTVSFGE